MKLRIVLTLAAVLGVVLIGSFYLQQTDEVIESQVVKQSELGIYWDDANQPDILPILLQSYSMVVTETLDIQVRQNGQVITETNRYIGNGFTEVGTGLVTTVFYEFDLQPGTYDVYSRLRIEVEADNLAVGTNPDNTELTEDRIFYGVHLQNGVVLPVDENGYSLFDTYIIDYTYYLPIIVKQYVP